MIRRSLTNYFKAPRQDSMLDAAKFSLKEAERLEAQGEGQAENYKTAPRTSFEAMRDELLLANAQASIAIAEALAEQADTRARATATKADAEAKRETLDTKTRGKVGGTATIQVLPDFKAFEGEEFKDSVDKAVRRALRRL